MEMFEAILLTVITAATPLLLASTGELVAERSGVLNLGVEGMMIMGAACGFAAAELSGSDVAGIAAGAGAGVAMALLFAALTIGLGANQVACGLALTILGIGLSGLIGGGFVGTARQRLPALDIPGLSDLPVIGQVVFGQDGLVYLSFLLVILVSIVLNRTRGGLLLRAVGDSHASAHALGYSVRLVRLLAVLFGGACAGLGGAYLSLAYTPFWATGMTAGRGWIALALVVFGSWMPWRVLAGAYLFGAVTILQFHAQGAGLGLPSQLMSALPYIATVLVLVLISAVRGRGQGQAPACLGIPFLPDR